MKPEAKAALLDSIKVRTLEARVAELEAREKINLRLWEQTGAERVRYRAALEAIRDKWVILHNYQDYSIEVHSLATKALKD